MNSVVVNATLSDLHCQSILLCTMFHEFHVHISAQLSEEYALLFKIISKLYVTSTVQGLKLLKLNCGVNLKAFISKLNLKA